LDNRPKFIARQCRNRCEKTDPEKPPGYCHRTYRCAASAFIFLPSDSVNHPAFTN
jgi:hypothetical protein